MTLGAAPFIHSREFEAVAKVKLLPVPVYTNMEVNVNSIAVMVHEMAKLPVDRRVDELPRLIKLALTLASTEEQGLVLALIGISLAEYKNAMVHAIIDFRDGIHREQLQVADEALAAATKQLRGLAAPTESKTPTADGKRGGIQREELAVIDDAVKQADVGEVASSTA